MVTRESEAEGERTRGALVTPTRVVIAVLAIVAACAVLHRLRMTPSRWIAHAMAPVLRWEWAVRAHDYAVFSVAISPDATTIASGSYDGSVKLWDATNGKLRAGWRQQDHVHVVRFSRDGASLFVGDGVAAREIELASQRTRHIFRGHGGAVNDLALDPRGGRVATVGDDGTVRLFALASGEETRRIDACPGSILLSVAFSPSGRWLATGGHCRDVSIWNVETGAEVVRVVAGSAVDKVTFVDDQTLMASADDGAVSLWRVPTGERVVSETIGGGELWALALLPDGKSFVVGGDDGVLRQHCTKSLLPIVYYSDRTERRGTLSIAIASSPGADPAWMVTGGGDGAIKRWRLPSRAITAERCEPQ